MPTILCIDDDPVVLLLYKSLLETKGYTVLTSPDGAAGIALTRVNPPDAVVLDFKMPGMDGAQVAEVLMREQPNLPVLICSGCPYEVPESLKWFAALYVEKGEGPKALLAAVQTLIAKNPASGPVSEIPQSHHAA